MLLLLLLLFLPMRVIDDIEMLNVILCHDVGGSAAVVSTADSNIVNIVNAVPALAADDDNNEDYDDD